ncbi:TonB-dependent receptor [Roseateles oligotrophus]|uniref:TonB-dependent receptor n=1 Tax=Roseateles oligotrophus TaxID=1769250 RepID=A0ABT2YD31_9BURK|nr:TonB-dependent receptor [Roseateles oligotrophus]MCV2367948.1 TonB-dependent receptor [Roseateles oligotrophus]
MTYPFNPSVLSLCLLAAFSAQVSAQSQTTPAPKTLDTVLVSGQGASLRNALAKQQSAQGIINVVHADGIGQLPDNNAAEALARIPGVSVERDQGEGRFVRVRGLGPDLNAVSINGTLVPSAEADRRAVGLDVVPAGLIRSLVVTKTATPDQDANSLGGSVEVNTLSAFDQPGRFLTLSAGLNYADLTGKTKPAAALIYSDRFFTNTLGVALTLSTDARSFGSDNVETGGAWDLAGAKPALSKLERRSYTITRERRGAALNLDLHPDALQSYYLRMFSSRFTDTEQRQAQTLEFSPALAEGASGSAKAARTLKAREEASQIDSLSLGGERRWGDWKLLAAIGAGRASEDKPDTLSGATYKNPLSQSGLSFKDSQQPIVSGPASMAGAKDFALDKIKMEKSLATDRERNLKLDLLRDLELSGVDLEIKGGFKLARREKNNEREVWSYGTKVLGKPPYGFSKDQLAMGAVVAEGMPRYPWGELGPNLSDAAIRQLIAPLKAAEFRVASDSAVNDYRIEENTGAAYLQARVELKSTQVITGLRHESFSMNASGTGNKNGKLSPQQTSTSSKHWLPALLIRHDLKQDTQLRAAYTESVVRPTFGQLTPGFVIEDKTAEFGNPELKPLRSQNLDFGLERRIDRDGAASAYVFHKDIKDFVYRSNLAGQGAWVGFDSAISYANGEAAKVSGLELSYSQALRRLPAPFNGLIVGANATLVSSEATIGGFEKGKWQQRKLALPSQSDRSLNFSLGWEGYGLSTRLAANYKSAYLLEVGDVLNPAKDMWVDAQTQLDFSLRYDITPKLQISFEALNLSDQPYYVYAGRSALNSQYEQYGRSYKLGLKLAVF